MHFSDYAANIQKDFENDAFQIEKDMIDSIFLRKIVSWIRNYYLFLQSETIKIEYMTRPEEEKKEPRKGWASRFAGKWKDSRSAEEIMKEIRTARTNNT